ncbi:MAG: FHA domain-containing protein [Nostocaceae cyanobacterium]|nr:FHA domain-containing protein [Nostocaceae cyanobacterium]
MADLLEPELEQRLNLYQVFLKLYENHTALLDDILQLENLSQPSFTKVKPLFVQGVIDTSGVYVITNLSEGKTQRLLQPQQIWTIGRDDSNGICIDDKHMSRHHAAIRYIEEDKSFYLVDFGSTNGSFVNGEPVYQSIRLQDGDRIRLGTFTFSFLMNITTQILPAVAMESLMQLVPQTKDREQSLCAPISEPIEKTLEIFRPKEQIKKIEYEYESLSAECQSEILDRFFRRQNSQYFS